MRMGFCLGFVWTLCSCCLAEDSNQFRGPKGNGVFADQDIPLEWSAEKNLAWEVAIKGAGWSQPVIWKGQVYLTTAVGNKDFKPKNFMGGVQTPQSRPGYSGKAPDIEFEWRLVCLNEKNGDLVWDKLIKKGKPKFGIHPSNSFATETPVVNKHGVFAYFGMAGVLAAFDHSGKLRWEKEIGQFKTDNDFGSGSSLATDNQRIFLQKFGTNVAEVYCFDCEKGQQVWMHSRENNGSSWSTPVVWKNKQRAELVISGSNEVESLDPKTGKLYWKAKNIKSASASSVCTDDNKLFFGSSDPFSKGPLFAVEPGAKGDVTPENANGKFEGCVWLNPRAGPGMASPVAGNNQVFVVERSILKCYDGSNGKTVYQERLPKIRMMAASPILIGDKLLVLDESGSACIVKAGNKFEILGQSKISDTFWSTPTVANDAIFMRGLEKLYCFRKKE